MKREEQRHWLVEFEGSELLIGWSQTGKQWVKFSPPHPFTSGQVWKYIREVLEKEPPTRTKLNPKVDDEMFSQNIRVLIEPTSKTEITMLLFTIEKTLNPFPKR